MLAKDLDAAWLPERVYEWNYVRMRTLFEQRKVKGFPQETLLVSSQKHGVVSKETYGLRTVVAQSGLENLKLVEPGDFVISLRSFQGGIEYARERGIISPAYTVLRLHENESLRYFGYLLKSSAFLDAIKITVTGIREGQNIDYSRLGRATVPVPPIEVQVGIVRYLDHAELRIAKAIQAKQKMVALLNEQKQVIISELVTRGLNPDAPTKDSGQAWLGQIPAHWDALPARALFVERITRNQPDAQMLSVSIKHGVTSQAKYLENSIKKDSSNSDKSAYKVVAKDDLVYNKMRAWQGAAGVSEFSGIVSPAYIVLRARAVVLPKYAHYVMRIKSYCTQVESLSYGISSDQWTLRPQHFKLIVFPVPSIEEQNQIVAAIDERTTQIDGAISAVEREIDLLKEYRTVLISNVVTGKKDIRAEAAELSDIDPVELAQVLSGAASVDMEEDEDDGTSEVE
jgi:type I restriction enzyme S subunit